jgi:alpha-N-arabinofuranosidase
MVMASYAPLLTNVNPGGLQWDTDLIGYDAMRSYGSPSYYAQVMFGPTWAARRRRRSWRALGSTAQAQIARRKLFLSVTRDAAKKKLYVKLVNASTTAQALEIDCRGQSWLPMASW